ncbi:MAG TPA: copper resistance protein NlpE N-terminal domain-containing protein [Pyrinomonadaceae bacterium]|nr:copper resistance protein NlpE N-terminal domain-containing protein [Pyrinomonadaceae bacterium]
MKSTVIIKLSLLSLITISPATQPVPASSSILGVFVASSPCDALSRELLKIPQAADCELIKWRLTLNHNPNTFAPTTYKLTYVYGLPEQGTNGLSRGETKIEREGRWAIGSGTKANSDAMVYQLDPDKARESLSFLKADNNLLHLLTPDKTLMVGNAGWSYTFNRVGDDGRHTPQARPLSISASMPDVPTAPAATDAAIVGSFAGRSPCREVATQLNKAVNADCMKVKWDLTLYQDSKLGPTTYKLKGTFYRKRIGEGRWAIVRGTKTDPAAVVYQLDPDEPQKSLFLLKADENILLFLDKERNLLVGNGDFSYTLNRTRNVLGN